MEKLIIILLVFLCTSCNVQKEQKIKLKGTKWNCKIAEGCINTYEFTTDSTFIFLSCEKDDEYFGNYYFKDGFLMLDQKGSVYDEYFSNSSIHNTEKKLYKIKIEENELKHLSVSDWINGKWIETNFKFDDTYLYKKVK